MKKEDFCYPGDFYYINKEKVSKAWVNNKILTIVALIVYFIISFLSMIGYYLLLPARIIHEICESRCY